ncbi:hypothetical protein ANO11243_023250 [Dothideomycetidae sp. 11243]|nr:hypothetical protein ANO11243_023250 [fungal sp. No.11243]
MAEILNKENLSPGRRSMSPQKSPFTSPARSSRRGRSKSIGPGAEAILESKKSSSPGKDRRKSSFAPAVKSILPSKEDEAKRREARRKSLANRRVSFAPEATLHTWDVIEYMREATTSSTSSENSRRNSRTSEDGEDDDEVDTIPATPDDQGRSQRKQRRRSSVIPPLNFNDPDDIYSSSPVSGSSPVSESDNGSEEGDFDDDGGEDMDEEDTAMSLVSAENTADITLRSNASNGTSDSSARLDAALRQAAEQAGTRGIAYDEFGDGYDELPALSHDQQEQHQQQRSWVEQQGLLTPMAKNLMAVQDQENINPFSPAFRAHAASGRPSTIAEEEEDEEDEVGDMSMEMTCAVGGINAFKESDSTAEDMTMDFTQVGGKIYEPSPVKNAAKRTRSTAETGSPMKYGNDDSEDMGRPAKRRRSSAGRVSLGDGTMDLTSAFGSIKPQPPQEQGDATMDFTTAIGNIVRSQSPIKISRRQSVRRRRSSAQSVMSVEQTTEQTMDFTTAVGAIRQNQFSPAKSIPEEDTNEDISMELTTALGNVMGEAQIPSRPTTPRHLSSPLQADPPTTPKDQGRFKEATDLSAKKLLTPILLRESGPSPQSTSIRAQQSPASSVRKPATADAGRASISPTRTPLQLPAPKNAGVRTPSLSPQRSLYPELPEARSELTPTPSPRRRQPASASRTPVAAPSTPERRSSPVKKLESPFQSGISMQPAISPARISPKKEDTTKAPSMLDSIRTMATPRKEANATPLKRLKDMTPKKTPLRTPLAKMRTPGPAPSTAPRVQFAAIEEEPQAQNDEVTKQLSEELARSTEPAHPVTLNGFLDLAGIKFMDLTASKRRYTVAPTPAKTPRSAAAAEEDGDLASAEARFEEAVAAGACTIPELDLYQHSCRELKRYMSEGKTCLKQLEAEVAADPPPFLRAYMSASPEQRAQWDRLVVDVKTRARLHSKELWYGWRTQLLLGLQEGLRGIERGLDGDVAELRKRREIIEDVLPSAVAERAQLIEELASLQDIAAQNSVDDREMLDSAREELLEVDEAVTEQREVLYQLQAQLEEQKQLVDMLNDGKSEAVAAIEEAHRVKEASRGISKAEAASYQGMSLPLQVCCVVLQLTSLLASIATLEKATRWSITAATASSLTMTYRATIQLYFNPAAFSSATSTIVARSPSKQASSMSPISLTYIADNEPLTTEKRFFLQLLRAQLHMLDPANTSARALLSFVSGGWDTAEMVAETVRKMQLEHPLEVKIVSDENLSVEAAMLLPGVQTKVLLGFDMQASVAEDGPDMKLETSTATSGKVVYGEPYKEDKMGDFLGQRVGKAMEAADEAVRLLRTRLEKTGRKSQTA